MKKPLLLLILICGTATTQQASFDYGKQLAEQMKNGVEDDIKSGKNKGEILLPKKGYKKDRDELKKESPYEEATSHTFEHLNNNKEGRDLVEIHKTRKPYILDDTEPFMVRSEKVHQHPEEAFKEVEQVEEGGNYTIETCEECPQEEYFVKARKTLKRYVYLDKPPYIETSGGHCNHGFFQVRITIPEEPENAFSEDGVWNIQYKYKTERGTDTYEHYEVNGVPLIMKKTILQNGGPWLHPGNCVMTNPLVSFVVSSPDIIKALLSSEEDQYYSWGRLGTAHLHHRVVNDTGQHYWILDDACQHYESLVEQGLCRYVSKEDDPPSDKYWKGKKVNGSWGQTVTYACRSSCKNTCEKLKARGCSREPNPKCIEKKGNKCLRWRWKFKCKDRIGMKKHKFQEGNPFCLEGNCIDSSYESDKDMIQALGYLSILEEVRKDLNGTKNIDIFKGNSFSCTRFPLSFKDCCGCNGWGVRMKLAGCDQDSKTVAKLRSEGKCIQIGTYCAEYVGFEPVRHCLRRKTVFCCFGSKFAKLLQEQGKPQLGLNFGTPECPNCRGFTVDELSRIDFSKLDLTEITNDVMDRFKPQDGEHFAKGVELDRIREQMQEKMSGSNSEAGYLKENMKHMTQSMRQGAKK